MTPCSSCARHVRHGEIACPFCGEPFDAPAPRNLNIIGRVTRAAVFSAALAGCAKHDQPKPAPHAGSAENLDQDFNQIVGSAEQGNAQPGSAQTSDAALAQTTDAAQVAVPVDAMSDEERTRQLQKQQQAVEDMKKQQQERERREHEKMIERQQIEQRHWNAKPYGAPPSRRRVV